MSDGSKSLDNTNASVEAHRGSDTRKKKKDFRPAIQPRYLIGSERKPVIVNDLKAFNDHRYKVFYATPKIDTKPPPFHALKFLNLPHLTAAMEGLRAMDRQNKLILQKINSINRSKGKVDTFNHYANNNCSKWGQKKNIFKKIDEENMTLYKKILKTKPAYPKAEHDEFWHSMLNKLEYYTKYPLCVIDMVTTDSILKGCPSIINPETLKLASASEKMGRPKIFLEFKMDQHINTIGRVIFELYNDVCPKTVENFLAICSGKNENNLTYKNCPVHKIYSSQFCIMGDITKHNGKGGTSIYGNFFEPENFDLEHTRPGVISMHCLKNNKVNSQFSITFASMPELNNEEVVFGKCIRGAEYLKKVNNYGTKTGKPAVKVIISKCGEVKAKKKPKSPPGKPKKNFLKLNAKAIRTQRSLLKD